MCSQHGGSQPGVILPPEHLALSGDIGCHSLGATLVSSEYKAWTLLNGL